MKEEVPSQTDLELFYRVENEPIGTFKKYDGNEIGTSNHITQHLINIDEVSKKIESAEKSECYIELISIRLQVIDFWLRVYFTNHPDKQGNREREFGRLLKQVFKLDFDKKLYDDLVKFNKHRVDAIHGFMIGTISYDKIKNVALEAGDLLIKSIIYVLRNVGEVVNSRNQLIANPGSMVIHVEDFCAEIEHGFRY